jgi:hypothetical protein
MSKDIDQSMYSTYLHKVAWRTIFSIINTLLSTQIKIFVGRVFDFAREKPSRLSF